ncbi:MAG: hypothetical protein A2Y25_09980 [Candidatus Melainabacteria bacterium GWF2_37_15]|nr:MAG: hypothetical protein A2Y25_09980 [Candidatus Melainabacteria bacterium GWF2_37_15]
MSEELKEQIIKEIQRVAKEQNLDTLPKRTFKKVSCISEKQVCKIFGSWNTAVEASGLNPDNSTKKKSNDEIFEKLLISCKKYKKIPTTFELDRTVFQKRFSSWPSTLAEFKKWLLENYPTSEFINLIEDKSSVQITKDEPIRKSNDIAWQRTKDVFYGAPMDFEGLRHEPINEQGVVFLFGKIHEKLGITVEAVKTGFPDCEDKRLIDKNKNHWERVLIEFEYRSKNFLEHGHDPNKCDVIVCWLHDWQECPIEVIELKSIIETLDRLPRRS